jgi:saccharopine dehydrogenase-like NADP-dependent oxidoreductase
MTNMNDRKILVVGGYGGVGRTIASDLSAELPGQVIGAGRSIDKWGIIPTHIFGVASIRSR